MLLQFFSPLHARACKVFFFISSLTKTSEVSVAWCVPGVYDPPRFLKKHAIYKFDLNDFVPKQSLNDKADVWPWLCFLKKCVSGSDWAAWKNEIIQAKRKNIESLKTLWSTCTRERWKHNHINAKQLFFNVACCLLRQEKGRTVGSNVIARKTGPQEGFLNTNRAVVFRHKWCLLEVPFESFITAVTVTRAGRPDVMLKS